MTRLTGGFHPGFDELSAYADRPDTEAARTKVGRHLVRCDVCRATVGEIRALGIAARASELPAAPAGLWARIEQRVEQGDLAAVAASARRETVVPLKATRDDDAPASPPTKGKKSWERRAALSIGAILLATSAVFVADSWRPLAAATPQRLTLDKEYVVPGGTVSAHYRPIAALAALPTVTVWAYYPHPSDETGSFDQGLVRAGVLRRISAQDYAGTLIFPRSAKVAFFIVGDSLGRVMDRSRTRAPGSFAGVIASDSRGRPRFDALVTLLAESRAMAEPTMLQRSAKAMTRFYPTRPETWILTYPIAHQSVISDIVKRFESRERVYYGWHAQLEHRAGLSAETEILMANVGRDLMDTARADFWMDRLIKNHPTHRAVPGLWISRYRDVPSDSAAGVLRAFEPIFIAAGSPQRDAVYRALALAERSDDAELARRWRLRNEAQGDSWTVGSDRSDWLSDSGERTVVERRLQERLAIEELDSLGTPTVWATARLEAYRNWHRRQRIRARLAAAQLQRGNVAIAKSALDSLVRDAELRHDCPVSETMRWRAEAERRLGDLTHAREDLAYVASTGDWRSRAATDSAATLLGAAYSNESWEQSKEVATERLHACFAAMRDRRRAEGW